MAKKSNVNPDHYKTAGREPPGQGVVQKVQKKKYTQSRAKQDPRTGASPPGGKTKE